MKKIIINSGTYTIPETLFAQINIIDKTIKGLILSDEYLKDDFDPTYLNNINKLLIKKINIVLTKYQNTNEIDGFYDLSFYEEIEEKLS